MTSSPPVAPFKRTPVPYDDISVKEDLKNVAERILQNAAAEGVNESRASLIDISKWFDSLLEEDLTKVNNETKELALRAIRCCLSRVQENQEKVITSALPLITIKTENGVSSAAAHCVLQAISTANAQILKTHVFPITRTIASALTRPHYQENAALELSSRTPSICMKILTVIFSRLSPLPSEIVNVIIDKIAYWVYNGFVAPRQSAIIDMEPKGRLQVNKPTPNDATSFAAMGAFLPHPTGSKPSSTFNRRSKRLPHNGSVSGWSSASECEDENGEIPLVRRQNFLKIRLDALVCLQALASNNAKALYIHWHHFLSDSPYTRNRHNLMSLIESEQSVRAKIQAGLTLETMLSGSASYLAIAEDRPTKLSFTSLSAKLGQVVADLHQRLTQTLILQSTSKFCISEFKMTLLRLAKTIAQNSPYGRLKTGMITPFLRAMILFLGDSETQVGVTASLALQTTLTRVIGQIPQGLECLDLSLIKADLLGEMKGQKVAENRVHVWDSLSTIVANTHDRAFLEEVLSLLGDEHNSENLQRSQLSFLASALKSFSSLAPSDCAKLLFVKHSSLIAPSVIRAMKGPDSQLRMIVCGLMTYPVLYDIMQLEEPSICLIEEALRMADDGEPTVSVAAVRTLGLLVKSPVSFERSASIVRIINLLQRRCKDPEPMKSSTSWSLANCCDIITPEIVAQIDVPVIVEEALSLANPALGEKVHTNGLRALGSLLRAAVPSLETGNVIALYQPLVEALCDGLQDGPAKVRWNAAAAIGNALAGPVFESSSTSASVQLLKALCSSLNTCANFKVRIQCANSLMVPRSRACLGPAENLRKLVESIQTARFKAEGESGAISIKEKSHYTQLLSKIEECHKHYVSMALTGDLDVPES